MLPGKAALHHLQVHSVQQGIENIASKTNTLVIFVASVTHADAVLWVVFEAGTRVSFVDQLLQQRFSACRMQKPSIKAISLILSAAQTNCHLSTKVALDLNACLRLDDSLKSIADPMTSVENCDTLKEIVRVAST